MISVLCRFEIYRIWMDLVVGWIYNTKCGLVSKMRSFYF